MSADVIKPVRPPFANVYWFPLAAFYGALILPWSVAGQFGWWWAPPGLMSGLGHAHEMLFGFALAVVAGYVLGPRPKKTLAIMIAIWFTARITALLWPMSVMAALFNTAFIMHIVYLVAPTYLRTAKKWRNKSVPFILSGLMLSVVMFHAFLLSKLPGLSYPVLLEAVLLLSALMYFMGGRMIAPAMAGHLQQKGIRLVDRVQPRIEGGVLILLALALLLQPVPFFWARITTGLLLLACAALGIVRTLRWRIWYCWNRADLVALLLGYSWLMVGWLLVGLALCFGWRLTPMLHAITVGALGTLTLSVMLRSRMHRCLKDPNEIPWFYAVVPLISVAALLRIFESGLASYSWASAAWGVAFACLFLMMLYLAWYEKKGIKANVRRKLKPAPGMARIKHDN